MAGAPGPLVPVPAFVIKTRCAGGRRPDSRAPPKAFLNVCGLEAVGRPVTRAGALVADALLDTVGIDGLQVPIHVGPLWEDVDHDGHPCYVTDVVVHPAVTVRCTAPGPLQAHFRRRVTELALQFAEEEHRVLGELSRQATIPRMAYKGLGPPQPVIALGDAAEAAPQKRHLIKAVPITGGGPAPSGRGVVAASTPQAGGGLRRGFLTDARSPLYPTGSGEGTVPAGAGDPLGFLPPGLRQTCKVMDLSDTNPPPKPREGFQQPFDKSAADVDPHEFLESLRLLGGAMFPDAVPRGPPAARQEVSMRPEAVGDPPGAPGRRVPTLGDLGGPLPPNTLPPASPAGDLAPACPTAPSVGPVAPATVEDPPPAAPYRLWEAEGGLRVSVDLPDVESMACVELTVEPRSLRLEVSGRPRLELSLPAAVREDLCGARFIKKERRLDVRLPLA